MNKLFILYNQWLEYFTRNACSIYVWFHIFQIMFSIQATNEYIIATSHKAEKDKAWWNLWWTFADTIANWFKKAIYEKFNLSVDILIHKWTSDIFEKNLKNWYAYGIWLKYAGRLYSKIKEDNLISIDELDVDLKDHKIVWHFLTYFYSKKTKKYYILDSLNSSRKAIEMDISVFREWIDKWIFFLNCRTIEIKDKLVDYYLKVLKTWFIVYNVESLDKKNRLALDKAIRLRHLKIK